MKFTRRALFGKAGKLALALGLARAAAGHLEIVKEGTALTATLGGKPPEVTSMEMAFKPSPDPRRIVTWSGMDSNWRIIGAL